MASCDKSELEITPPIDREVHITSSIETRASGTSWSNNDQIGVYMNQPDSLLGALGANVLYTTTNGDGNFSTDTPLYYPTSGTVDLLAYYPRVDSNSFDPTAYAVDVTSQESLPLIDLMTASKENLALSKTAVDLTFAHKLTNIVIEIKAGDGFETSDLANVSVKLTGTKANASFNLTLADGADGQISFGTATATDISIPTSANGTLAEAIVIPQTLSDATLEFSFTGDEKVYSAEIATAAYEMGKTYSYAATINKTGPVALSAAGISGWVDGNGEGETLTTL